MHPDDTPSHDPTTRVSTVPVMLGSLAVGGGAPVSIQSMTNTKTADISATCEQIRRLARAGAQVLRLAVLGEADARALAAIRERLEQSGERPALVADIHFQARLARLAMEAGMDGIRLNPGNLDKPGHVADLARLAIERGVVIRVGVNGGSLKLPRGLSPSERAEAMIQAVRTQVDLLRSHGPVAIKVSLKASDPDLTLLANRRYAATFPEPLHLGLTEAGPPLTGAVRSTAVLVRLLSEGIGDTIRMSLCGDPLQEVLAARALLESLGLGAAGRRVIACPTCGRCFDPQRVADLAAKTERYLSERPGRLTVAVMGCLVNGPGEAAEADLGVFFTRGGCTLIVGGEKRAHGPAEQAEGLLLDEIDRLLMLQNHE